MGLQCTLLPLQAAKLPAMLKGVHRLLVEVSRVSVRYASRHLESTPALSAAMTLLTGYGSQGPFRVEALVSSHLLVGEHDEASDDEGEFVEQPTKPANYLHQVPSSNDAKEWRMVFNDHKTTATVGPLTLALRPSAKVDKVIDAWARVQKSAGMPLMVVRGAHLEELTHKNWAKVWRASLAFVMSTSLKDASQQHYRGLSPRMKRLLTLVVEDKVPLFPSGGRQLRHLWASYTKLEAPTLVVEEAAAKAMGSSMRLWSSTYSTGYAWWLNEVSMWEQLGEAEQLALLAKVVARV